MSKFRLVVCFDVVAENLTDAYDIVRYAVENGPGMAQGSIGWTDDGKISGWETSDEWYDHDGEPGDPDELQQAIVKSMKNRHIL